MGGRGGVRDGGCESVGGESGGCESGGCESGGCESGWEGESGGCEIEEKHQCEWKVYKECMSVCMVERGCEGVSVCIIIVKGV